MPGARCTRSPLCKVESTGVEATGPPEHPAFPHAMVLTAYVVISPVTGLFCHRRLADIVLSLPGWADRTPQNLTPASGRQDHTILPSAAIVPRQRAGDRSQVFRPALRSHRAQNAAASTASHPAFVTIMTRPSVGWDTKSSRCDLGCAKTEIFLQMGLDYPNQIEKSQQIASHALRPWAAHAAEEFLSPPPHSRMRRRWYDNRSHRVPSLVPAVPRRDCHSCRAPRTKFRSRRRARLQGKAGEPRSSPRSQFGGSLMRWAPLQTSIWYLQQWRLPKQAAKREEQNDLPGRRATLDSRPQPAPEIRDRSVTTGFIRWRRAWFRKQSLRQDRLPGRTRIRLDLGQFKVDCRNREEQPIEGLSK
jgi:hypothetical protein